MIPAWIVSSICIVLVLFIGLLMYGMLHSAKVIHESFEEPLPQLSQMPGNRYQFGKLEFDSYKAFQEYFYEKFPDRHLPTMSASCARAENDQIIFAETVSPPDYEYFHSCHDEEEEEEEDEENPMKKTPIAEESSSYEPNPKILAPYGFTYMPNTLWSVPQYRPPVCIPQQKIDPTPVLQSSFSDVMEYTGLGSIMPRFNYEENYKYSIKELRDLANKKFKKNPNYLYPGYYTNSPQKIEDLI